MSTNLKYAIVSGRIIQYQSGSLKYEINEWDHVTPMVKYLDTHGINCVTSADNFIEGTYEELQAIINEWDRIHEEKVKSVCARYPQATDTEKKIIDYMIGDEYDPDELSYEEIQSVTQGTLRYCEFNASLHDAYIDYMH